jgi:hypothetical protein
VLRQQIETDQEYESTMEHLAGILNVGADGLSRHSATSKTPVRMLEEVYTVDKLDHNKNELLPIAMRLVNTEQDKDDTLQQLLNKPYAVACFTMKEYKGINAH